MDSILGKPAGSSRAPWHRARGRFRSRPRERNPRLYQLVIDQFDVESNPRYRTNHQGKGETYCNIFVWDVTRAMGAEIPHWVDSKGNSVTPSAGLELDANAAIEWLRRHGVRFGWSEVDALLARESAASGMPIAAVLANDDSPGHMAMVRPEPAAEGALLVAQAGERNASSIGLGAAFGQAVDAVRFFAHD